MSITLSTPVTGGAQTGFTTPTYTVASDIASDFNGKQWAVTALGGTQTGVTTHTQSSPFTWSYYRPKSFKLLGKPNPVTGLISNVPKNTTKIIVRKGVTPAPNQLISIASINMEINIPAGADVNDAANIRALISLAQGALSQLSASFADTVISGIV